MNRFGASVYYAVDKDGSEPVEISVEGRQKLNEFTEQYLANYGINVDISILADYNILIYTRSVEYNGVCYNYLAYDRDTNTARCAVYNPDTHTFELTDLYVVFSADYTVEVSEEPVECFDLS